MGTAELTRNAQTAGHYGNPSGGRNESIIRESFARPLSIPALIVLYLILPNLAFLLATWALDTSPQGRLDVECIVLGAACLFLSRRTAFLLLFCEALADLVYIVCFTYRFTLFELVYSARYLMLLPNTRLLRAAIVLLISAVAAAFLASLRARPTHRLRAALALLAAAALATVIDMANGQNMLWPRDTTATSVRLARSPVLVLALWERAALRVDASARQSFDQPVPSASSHALALLGDGRNPSAQPNLVLIMVESWGLPKDVRLARQMLAPYDDPRLRQRYQLISGAVPFTGLTVPGETRELCQSGAGFGILEASPAMLSHCLPALLHRRGYRSIAIHGFVGRMFNRLYFASELRSLGFPSCPGAFPGTCDSAIAAWLPTLLESPPANQPKFLYWVTLNSHLPTPARPALPEDGQCSQNPLLDESTPLCSWFRLVHAVHASVARAAIEPLPRPTIFVLVGDHAPPFSSPFLRSEFSSGEVPYLILAPLAPPSSNSAGSFSMER